LQALSHPEAGTPVRAVYILGEKRTTDAVGALTRLFRRSKDPFLQGEVIEAMSKIGGDGAFSLLVEALHHPSFIVRGEAAKALSRFPGTGSVKHALERALTDPSSYVREMGKQAISHLRSTNESRRTDLMVLQEQTEIHDSDELPTMVLKQRGCPICLILQKRTHDLMCKLQFEAVHNQEVNARLLSVGGYCHFHFWYLEKLASPVTNAQLLEDLLGKIERECIQSNTGDAAASFGDASGCPVCCSCRDWEENLLRSFAGRIQEKDFRAAYETSRGLCLPHLAKALTKLPGKEERSCLLASSRGQVDALIKELRLLITKWGDKDHRPGEEKDSPYRAIGKLVGAKYYWAG
jgi:hypothetical protein